MRRRNGLLFAAALLGTLGIGLLLLFLPVLAQTEPTPTPRGSYVVVASVFVRGGPGEDFSSVTALNAGAVVTPIARDASGEWVQIRVGNRYGWLRRDLAFWAVNVDNLPIADAASTPELLMTPTATVLFPTDTPEGSWVSAEQGVFVRSGPGLTYEPLGTLTPGTTVEPVGRTSELDWILIRYGTGFGWVLRSLVRWDMDLRPLSVLVRGNLTPSPTFTRTPVPTSTLTATATLMPTLTLTPTLTATPTLVPTSTVTATMTPSLTSVPTATTSHTAMPIPTNTTVSTATLTMTLTPVPTFTSTHTPSHTMTTMPSATPPPTATLTLAASDTPVPTETPPPTATDTATATSEPSATLTATIQPTATSAPTSTETPVATPTAPPPTAIDTSSPVPLTATSTPSPTVTATTVAVAVVPTQVLTSATPVLPTALPSGVTSVPSTLTSTPLPTIALTAAVPSTDAVTGVPTATMTVTPTAAAAVAALPTTLPSITAITIPEQSGGLRPELLAGLFGLLLVGGYGLFYWRGLAAVDRYRNGFIIKRCPVCLQGDLVVETKRERLLGIPRPRHAVYCTHCRSVLRHAGNRQWRYAVDRLDNPLLYGSLNNHILTEEQLRELAQSAARYQKPPKPRTPPTPPQFVDDEEPR